MIFFFSRANGSASKMAMPFVQSVFPPLRSRTMNSNFFGDPPTFPLVPPWGWPFWISVKWLNYCMACNEIWTFMFPPRINCNFCYSLIFHLAPSLLCFLTKSEYVVSLLSSRTRMWFSCIVSTLIANFQGCVDPFDGQHYLAWSVVFICLHFFTF